MSTTLVLPGDAICPPISDHLTLGPGIASCTSRAGSSSAGNLIASKLGLLTSVKGKEKDGGESLWIDSSSKRVSRSNAHTDRLFNFNDISQTKGLFR